MTRHIMRLIRKKQRQYNKVKKTRNDHDWAVFREHRTRVKKELLAAYHNYIDSLTSSATRKDTLPKRFWTYVKNLRKDFVGIPPLKDHNDCFVSSNKGKANMLSSQYQAAFTKEDLESMPTMPQSPYAAMPGITLTVKGVHSAVTQIETWQRTWT